MSSIEQIDASMRTDQGRVREHNEDFIACREPASPPEETKNGWLYIVADGVGGADAGEIASQYATERTLYHYLADDQTEDWGERLVQAMQEANTELRQLMTEQALGSRMATTMVAVVLQDDKAIIANVGDSRAYHWRNGFLKQVTKDQSLVARLLEEGAITEEEAINHPRKNVILHSLGSENSPQIDIYELALMPGEQLVLCSDGLTRHVSDEEIAALVTEQTPDQATEKLIRLANERGGEDNISVAVLRIGEQPTDVSDSSRPRMVIGNRDQQKNAAHRQTLWVYTAILVAVQIVLIIMVWNLINS